MNLVSQAVPYRDGDTELSGWLFFDESRHDRRPGILVVHGGAGLDDHAKSRARGFAEQGYVALACDMYGAGVAEAGRARIMPLILQLCAQPAKLRQRAHAGLEILRAHPLVDGTRLAAIGYCFGGMTVLELARDGADLAAVISVHGSLQAAQSIAQTHAPKDASAQSVRPAGAADSSATHSSAADSSAGGSSDAASSESQRFAGDASQAAQGIAQSDATNELATQPCESSGAASSSAWDQRGETASHPAIRARVLVCHGALDPHVPMAHITGFADEMAAAQADWQLIIYGDALHGFTHETPSSTPGVAYHPQADARSSAHIAAFLADVFRT